MGRARAWSGFAKRFLLAAPRIPVPECLALSPSNRRWQGYRR